MPRTPHQQCALALWAGVISESQQELSSALIPPDGTALPGAQPQRTHKLFLPRVTGRLPQSSAEASLSLISTVCSLPLASTWPGSKATFPGTARLSSLLSLLCPSPPSQMPEAHSRGSYSPYKVMGSAQQVVWELPDHSCPHRPVFGLFGK